MHELSLAVSLVDEATAILKRENGNSVRKVCVSIGALSGVEREPFEFCFPLAVEGTALDGAELFVEDVPAKVQCKKCLQITNPDVPFLMCSECGSTEISVIAGRDFMITSLEIE